MENVLAGLDQLLQFQVLAALFTGAIVGVIIGAIPGVGPAVAIARAAGFPQDWFLVL